MRIFVGLYNFFFYPWLYYPWSEWRVVWSDTWLARDSPLTLSAQFINNFINNEVSWENKANVCTPRLLSSDWDQQECFRSVQISDKIVFDPQRSEIFSSDWSQDGLSAQHWSEDSAQRCSGTVDTPIILTTSALLSVSSLVSSGLGPVRHVFNQLSHSHSHNTQWSEPETELQWARDTEQEILVSSQLHRSQHRSNR